MHRTLLFLLCTIVSFISLGTDFDPAHAAMHFVENKGQWESPVLFRAPVNDGALYLEHQAFTWNLMHPEDVHEVHEMHHGRSTRFSASTFEMRSHAFRTSFIGSNPSAIVHGDAPTTDFVNYFLGNDPDRWAPRVKKYRQVHYSNMYPGIDLLVYSKGPDLKYDFVLEPGADPDRIQMAYAGADSLSLRDGKLHIHLSFSELVEQRPYAYQVVNGKRQEVSCRFVLTRDVVSFELTEEYRTELPLVIDPRIVFSSYTGSSRDNWGFTATYDAAGSLYAGGITFGSGYPTTLGAFQEVFQGGNSSQSSNDPFEVTISKFSPDGSSLEYSTYLGGTGNEAPHSLVVNSQNELIVFGTTSSADFPSLANSYDTTFNGGFFQPAMGLLYSPGSDFFLAKFSAAGDMLTGSTVLGGNGNEGLNTGDLGEFNYGDYFRGEVVVDDNDNIYAASTTNSANFPVTNGAFQTSIGGGYHDGVVFRFSADLSTLNWASYFGGSGYDAAYALQLNSLGELYITGGTQSTDLPGPNGGLHANNQGNEDGFVARISPDGQQLINRTYLGTGDYDQCFFVQIDPDDAVYLFGQTEGSYPVTPGKYVNPNSGQFIQKLTPALDQSLFSTVVGTGSGHVDLTLTAFLVTDCGEIFIAGWGGQTNFDENPNSTTTGLPITTPTYQSTTDGSDFYLMVLDTNATSLVLATFFGGDGLGEHCDGGTSRFDKSGRVYQAVCAGCGGSNDFPTTPGAWSETNGSSNCNLAAVKYDVSTLVAEIGFNANFSPCAPTANAPFENLSTGAVEYVWLLGDGTTSTEFEPQHSYQYADSFTVTLVARNPGNFCDFEDTATLNIVIDTLPTAHILPPGDICVGDTIVVDGSQSVAESFSWSPAGVFADPNSAVTQAWPPPDSEIELFATNDCGTTEETVFVAQRPDPTSISSDTTICGPSSVPIRISGGSAISWAPSENVFDYVNPLEAVFPVETTTVFTVEIKDSNNCVWEQQTRVQIDNLPRALQLSPDTMICRDDSVLVRELQGFEVTWENADFLQPIVGDRLALKPVKNMQLTATISNSCGTVTDQTRVYIDPFRVAPLRDTLVCKDAPFEMRSGNAESYQWSPASATRDDVTDRSFVNLAIADPVRIFVLGIDSLGCRDSNWAEVSIKPNPLLELGEDVIIDFGGSAILTAIADTGTLQWLPDPTLDCPDDCLTPVAYPLESTTYYARLDQTTGCFNTDSVRVRVEGAMYAPNAFSPNGDGDNDVFYIYGVELNNFRLQLFDRWGSPMYESGNQDRGWDGTLGGKPAPIGVYVWRVEYSNLKGQNFFKTGRVTLVR